MSAADLADALRRPAVVAEGSVDRCRPLAEMLRLVPELCRRFDITRIADLTHLDRARLPVMNAIVPRSADAISTYNGKGPTRDHAIVGAVMEAVERQAAACEPGDMTSFAGSQHAGDRVGFDALRCEFSPVEPIPYVRGIDLATLAPVWIPQGAVTMPFSGDRLYRRSTTNGLASGSSLVEATHHALLEVIERHLFSLTHARAHIVPRLSLGDFFGTYEGSWTHEMIDDPICTRLAFPTGNHALDERASTIRRAGLDLSIVVVAERALPTLAVAVVSEAATKRAHLGMACSFSSLHAASRALDEAVQSRLGDTSGGREDLTPIGAPGSAFTSRYADVPSGRWFFDAPHVDVDLAALPEESCGDLTREIRLALRALRDARIGSAYAVDLTPRGCPVAVVRVVAPLLESSVVDGRIGPMVETLLQSVSLDARTHFASHV